jgi:signal transduction histidine kinase
MSPVRSSPPFTLLAEGVMRTQRIYREMREVTLRIESSKKAPRLSRSHLAQMRESLGPRYDDVVLLVSELVSNSVRHSESGEIDLKVLTADGHIRVEVSDGGPGFTNDQPRGEGLGLSLVDKLADRWGIESADRFTVWAELNVDHRR